MHPIRNPNFRALLISRIFGRLSYGFFDLPFMWWVMEKTGNESMVAVVALVGSIAWIVGSPFGGNFADKYKKTKIAAILMFIDGSLTFIAGILFLNGIINITVALILLTITNFTSALRSPGLSALLPIILEEADYQKGNATMGLANSFSGLASFALAGVLTSVIGVGWTIIIGAALLFIALVAILLVKEPEKIVTGNKDEDATKKSKDSFWQGFRVIVENPLLLSVVLTIAVLNFAVSPLNAILVPYAARLKAGASGYGYLQSALIVGEIIGLASLNIFKLKNTLKVLIISTLAIGSAIIALAIFRVLPAAVLMMALMGISASVMTVTINTIIQTRVDKEVMGRAYGVMGIISSGAQPVAYAITGVLLASIGLYNIIYLSGGMLLATSLIWLNPVTRKGLSKPPIEETKDI